MATPEQHIGPIEGIIDDELIGDFDVKYVGALRCARAVIPFLKEQGWGRIVNISGGNARNAGNLSGGARNASLVHFTKTLSNQLGQFGITVNCIHPGTTRTERTPGLIEARAKQLGISVDEVESHEAREKPLPVPHRRARGRRHDSACTQLLPQLSGT